MLQQICLHIQESLQDKDNSNNYFLAVRSSSTLEDLKGMAGAGLYDSVLNVDIRSKQAILSAIEQVWKSLFTERAIVSRKRY